MDQQSQAMKYDTGLEVKHDYDAPEAHQADLEAVPAREQTPRFQEHWSPAAASSPYSTGSGDEKLHEGSPPQESETESKICGLRKTTFWLALALLVVIILAVVIGGAVGGSVNTSKAGSDVPGPSTLRPTTTTLIASTATSTVTQQVATATPSSQCPSANLQNWTSTDLFYGTGLTYTKVCGVDLDSSVSKQNVARGIFNDFHACIVMCDSINALWAVDKMNVVIWSWSGQGAGGMQPKGNCWCVEADAGYSASLIKVPGEDAAFLTGTFAESDLPE